LAEDDLNIKLFLDCLSFSSSWVLVSIRRGKSRGPEDIWFLLQSLLLLPPYQPSAELAPGMLSIQTILKMGFTKTSYNLKEMASFHLKVL